jgi:hypothetical protein
VLVDPDVESDDEDKSTSKSDDGEQFACTICRGPFKNAIETVYVLQLSALKQVECCSISCVHAPNGI